LSLAVFTWLIVSTPLKKSWCVSNDL
jgi:hypothetical protein